MPRLLKNLLRGAGSVMNIFPTRPEENQEPKLYHPALSVEEALRRDWEKVGHDMWQVISHEKSRHSKEEKKY